MSSTSTYANTRPLTDEELLLKAERICDELLYYEDIPCDNDYQTDKTEDDDNTFVPTTDLYLNINCEDDLPGFHSKTRIGQETINHMTTHEFPINTLKESINQIENELDQYQEYRSAEVECDNMTHTETVFIEDVEDEEIEFTCTDENISPEKTFILP
ncbi:hypothetical protein FQA39_LY18371 [Lamprigera yunnana]|nr:hypothetical protein FQA39_LY18371 [Lamprigera yunnana]